MAGTRPTDSERATVWSVWHERRDMRLVRTPLPGEDGGNALAEALHTGVYDLHSIGNIAEWLEWSIEKRTQGMALAYWGTHEPSIAAARVGQVAGTRVGWSASFRAQRVLEDMLGYLGAEEGKGVRDVLSFLAYVHSASDLFTRLNARIGAV